MAAGVRLPAGHGVRGAGVLRRAAGTKEWVMDNQLLVKIATDTSPLRSQLDQATGVITGFSSSVKSALGGMLAGLSVGGAAAYFTSITKGAIEAGDRIGE